MNGLLVNQDSGEKTWLTPKWVIESLGHFDLDPCCPPNMPWRTADVMLTPKEDGLKQPWSGRVWLNPPYGREAKPFIEKMVEHAKNGGGISLLFARTETKLWQQIIAPNMFSVLFLNGRMSFCRADGSLSGSSTAPSALISFSAKDMLALERFRAIHGGIHLTR